MPVFQGPEHSLVFKKELQTKQTSFQNGLATGDSACLHDLNSPSDSSLCISQVLLSLVLHALLSRSLSSTGFSSICCFSRMNFISYQGRIQAFVAGTFYAIFLKNEVTWTVALPSVFCHVLVFHLGLVWGCIKIPLQNKGKYWVSAFGLEIRRGTWTTGWWTIMEFSKRFWQIHFAYSLESSLPHLGLILIFLSLES